MVQVVRTFTVIVASMLVAGGLGAPAGARPPAIDLDAVQVWNGLALDAVRVTRATDADAARTYAMLNVAVYDAVNGISRTRTPALVPPSGPRGADLQAAAVAAAYTVLSSVDAEREPAYRAQLDADLARLPSPGARKLGETWGRQVGQAVVAARADDGSRPVESQPAGTGPEVFRAAWSGVQYRNVRPFAVADPAAHVPGPPPALDSLDYAAAFAEVALLGDARIPAPDKLATFQFWSLPAGSVQPPGEWLRIGLTVAEARHLPLADEARLTALLSMASADATVATVATKFQYRHWRPTTAIQEADTDGNPYTNADPGWAPRAGSVGGSPEYVSGHSSYSGAGAVVLAGFFCDDAIGFSHATDSAPGGQARSYPSFSAAAAEAGRSRVYGGQHFEFSNQTGLAIGSGVGSEVLATRLLRRGGPTHHGSCPL
jgi:membrane-associated phospholipid phosphatase